MIGVEEHIGARCPRCDSLVYRLGKNVFAARQIVRCSGCNRVFQLKWEELTKREQDQWRANLKAWPREAYDKYPGLEVYDREGPKE